MIVLVATIGVAQLSLAILNAYPDLVGKGRRFPHAVRPRVWNVGDVRISRRPAHSCSSSPRSSPLALGWFLNRTLLGRTVRAAAGNPDLARLSGINPKSMSTLRVGDRRRSSPPCR